MNRMYGVQKRWSRPWSRAERTSPVSPAAFSSSSTSAIPRDLALSVGRQAGCPELGDCPHLVLGDRDCSQAPKVSIHLCHLSAVSVNV